MSTEHLDAGEVLRGQRIFDILHNFVVRLERQPRPHPELVEMAGFAVDRLMEHTYRCGALESCLEATKLGNLLGEMLEDTIPVEEARQRLGITWSSLEAVHAGEMARQEDAAWRNSVDGARANQARMQAQPPAKTPPARPVLAPTPPAPDGGVTPSRPPHAPDTSRGSEIPADGSLPPDTRDGSFAYLGTDGFPFDRELTAIFLTEAGEQLPAVEQILLKMEKNPFQGHGITDLFRVLHTIKGNSGFLGLREFIRLVHAMEQYLEPFRSRSASMDTFDTALLLDGLDALKRLLDNLQHRVDVLDHAESEVAFEPVDWEALAVRVLEALPSS